DGQKVAYDPGIWFNSAKFMDLEWQVYGQVPPKPGEGEATLFWQHDSGKKSLRIHYREEDGRILGFNVMGIRYRHELCQQWLEEGRPLPYVLENLGAANFDPELYRQHEADLLAIYNRQHPDAPLRLKRRRGLKHLFQLRKAG
ncbi:MAG: NAD(P)/FAD-dependent oxidoreductase, partial [Acidobacteria bacterium]|nr:NAD(P)/FAD-dependent oxidoreductase [Acidobacteriota bacterium]